MTLYYSLQGSNPTVTMCFSRISFNILYSLLQGSSLTVIIFNFQLRKNFLVMYFFETSSLTVTLCFSRPTLSHFFRRLWQPFLARTGWVVQKLFLKSTSFSTNKVKSNWNQLLLFSKHCFEPDSEDSRLSLICMSSYLIIVADAADAVSVNFSGRCKFWQI